MDMTMQSNGLGRFIQSMLPTGLTPFSFGVGGAVAKALTGKSIEGLVDSVAGPQDLFGDVENIGSSYINSVTAAGLTGQQIAQNEWTAMREDTRYQRFVQDLEKAGINSAMLLGKSVQPSNASPSASPSPNGGSFSNMLELAALAAQIKNIKADTQAKEADAAEKESRASLNSQLEQFNNIINPLRVKAQELSNNLTAAEERKAYSLIGEIEQRINKLIAETHTEEERAALVVAQTLAENARAYQIYELTPYQVALTEAQTEAQKAAARLSAVNAAYQSKLLNSGYIEAMFSEMQAKADSAEARAAMDQIRASIRNGTFGVSELGDSFLANVIEVVNSTASKTLAGFVNFVDNLNPFGSMLK